MVCESTSLYHFHRLQLLQASLLCNLVLTLVSIMLEVSYIGDVANITHLVTQVSQQFYEYVVCHSRTGMSKMCVAINSRAADIQAYASLIDGFEDFLFPSQGIGDI
jgi:hypothetical protein